MPRLAIFAAGFGLGIVATLWAIGRSMGTPETKPKVPAWVHDDEALPPFDPHLWRERMK